MNNLIFTKADVLFLLTWYSSLKYDLFLAVLIVQDVITSHGCTLGHFYIKSANENQKVKVSCFKQWCESNFNGFASSPLLLALRPSGHASTCFPLRSSTLSTARSVTWLALMWRGSSTPPMLNLNLKMIQVSSPTPPITTGHSGRFKILQCLTARCLHLHEIDTELRSLSISFEDSFYSGLFIHTVGNMVDLMITQILV